MNHQKVGRGIWRVNIRETANITMRVQQTSSVSTNSNRTIEQEEWREEQQQHKSKYKWRTEEIGEAKLLAR